MEQTPQSTDYFTFRVARQYFDLIKSGKKTVEGRCATGGYITVKVGDIVKFQVDSGDNVSMNDEALLTCEINRVQHYKTFSDMLQAEGIENCLPGTTDLELGVATYRSFPLYEEKERNFGVLAFEIKLCQ